MSNGYAGHADQINAARQQGRFGEWARVEVPMGELPCDLGPHFRQVKDNLRPDYRLGVPDGADELTDEMIEPLTGGDIAGARDAAERHWDQVADQQAWDVLDDECDNAGVDGFSLTEHERQVLHDTILSRRHTSGDLLVRLVHNTPASRLRNRRTILAALER